MIKIQIPTEIDRVKILEDITAETNITLTQIEKSIQLLSEGNTIPFIARYRKEVTGGLDEIKLRDIQKKYEQKVNLNQRKLDVIRMIQDQRKLTDEIATNVPQCRNVTDGRRSLSPIQTENKNLGRQSS